MIKPVWTYGIQLWGSAAVTNIAILQRFENLHLHNDIDILNVEEEIKQLYGSS